MSTMRERFRSWFNELHGSMLHDDVYGVTNGEAVAFAESEVRLALQPREQASGLAEAEHVMRAGGPHGDVRLTVSERLAIAAELDRLRALEQRMAKIAAAYVRWHDDNDYSGETAMSDIGDVLQWADVRSLGGEP
jgi:hypothetical protein